MRHFQFKDFSPALNFLFIGIILFLGLALGLVSAQEVSGQPKGKPANPEPGDKSPRFISANFFFGYTMWVAPNFGNGFEIVNPAYTIQEARVEFHNIFFLEGGLNYLSNQLLSGYQKPRPELELTAEQEIIQDIGGYLAAKMGENWKFITAARLHDFSGKLKSTGTLESVTSGSAGNTPTTTIYDESGKATTLAKGETIGFHTIMRDYKVALQFDPGAFGYFDIGGRYFQHNSLNQTIIYELGYDAPIQTSFQTYTLELGLGLDMPLGSNGGLASDFYFVGYFPMIFGWKVVDSYLYSGKGIAYGSFGDFGIEFRSRHFLAGFGLRHHINDTGYNGQARLKTDINSGNILTRNTQTAAGSQVSITGQRFDILVTPRFWLTAVW